MPYFERKPVETLADAARSLTSVPGLPSRMQPAFGALPSSLALHSSTPLATDIVEQASAILEAHRGAKSVTAPPASLAGMPSPGHPPAAASPVPARSPGPAQATSPGSGRVAPLQEQVNALVEQVVSMASSAGGSAADREATTAWPHGADADCFAPAPVLPLDTVGSSGGCLKRLVTLVNEDQASVDIAFRATGLVGDGGERIPPENVSFQPRLLTLPPGTRGEVLVTIEVPPGMRPGAYTGLIRADCIDALYAVLIARVK